MKAKDLEVGKEYLSNPNHSSWDSSPFAWGTKRVCVLDTQVAHWRKTNGEWEKINGTSFRTTKGLLVQVLEEKTGQVLRVDVVTLASLRGEWEPLITQLTEKHRKLQDLQNRANKEQQERRHRQGFLVALANKVMGLKPQNFLVRESNSSSKVVEVDLDLFHAMLTQLDRDAWIYNPAVEESK